MTGQHPAQNEPLQNDNFLNKRCFRKIGQALLSDVYVKQGSREVEKPIRLFKLQSSYKDTESEEKQWG